MLTFIRQFQNSNSCKINYQLPAPEDKFIQTKFLVLIRLSDVRIRQRKIYSPEAKETI